LFWLTSELGPHAEEVAYPWVTLITTDANINYLLVSLINKFISY